MLSINSNHLLLGFAVHRYGFKIPASTFPWWVTTGKPYLPAQCPYLYNGENRSVGLRCHKELDEMILLKPLVQSDCHKLHASYLKEIPCLFSHKISFFSVLHSKNFYFQIKAPDVNIKLSFPVYGSLPITWILDLTLCL